MQVETDETTALEFIQQHWQTNDQCLRLGKIINRKPLDDERATVGLYVVCASEWNKELCILKQPQNIQPLLATLMEQPSLSSGISYEFGILKLQHDEICRLCGDDDQDNDQDTSPSTTTTSKSILPCPPEYLPTLLLVIRLKSMPQPHVKYVSTMSNDIILKLWRSGGTGNVKNDNEIVQATKKELFQELTSFGLTTSIEESVPTSMQQQATGPAIRIFVAGDRMSVGKTSVCLGLLGNLVQLGYPPETLAYIKPATQNEKPQLVQHYCEKMGITCISVGPIVYFRGFTRAYLAGETESSQELLSKVSNAVDEIAIGKRVVIIDGVGFPAVGSICGTDNASVALASSYPTTSPDGDASSRKPLGVLLVGGPGVGSAVDAFNLNATYCEMAGVPVLGAIFNKLSLDGFYSLENCKKQISLYFSENEHQIKHGRQPFGFCPLFPKLGGEKAMDHVLEYIRVFGEHVNMNELIASAIRLRDATSSTPMTMSKSLDPSPPKRPKVSQGGLTFRTREEIENDAIIAGAAPSA